MKHYILVDRSGSMSGRWAEVMGSLESYVQKLEESDSVTIKLFDTPQTSTSVESIVENAKPSAVKVSRINMARGMTPLFDALGRAYADLENEDRGVLLVLTDGYENASREHTHASVSALREAAQTRGVETIFIGANFDDLSDARNIGIRADTTVSVKDGSYGSAMDAIADKTRMYSSGAGAQTLNFSEEERTAWKK